MLRVISVDKYKSYPPAIRDLKSIRMLDDGIKTRQVKYLNNIIEQDHRFIKKLAKARLWFKFPLAVWRTLQGYETMHMIRKG